MSPFLISMTLLNSFPLIVIGRTECFLITGRLKCPSNPMKAVGVRIDLIDEDSLPWETDDIMGRTWSHQNGSFTISGCGSDFGPFNSPDAYLQIEHSCPHRAHGTIRTIEELNALRPLAYERHLVLDETCFYITIGHNVTPQVHSL